MGLIPSDFVSGTADARTETSAGALPIYTSGIQRLENLQTLVDVVYSPLFIDQQDYTVKDAFQSYIDASVELTDRVSKGPFRKFSNLLGFEFADISNEVDNLGLIYDIENAKDENLQYIAELIGWKLRGVSADKWRHQLRQAIDLYKRSGTMEAIQTAINLLITDSVLDVSAATSELWESYVPYLIWYSLGTESPLFKSLKTLMYRMVVGDMRVTPKDSHEANTGLPTESFAALNILISLNNSGLFLDILIKYSSPKLGGTCSNMVIKA